MEWYNMENTTRSGMKAELENMGVTGAAAEAILRETAGARHLKRVEAAKQAALAFTPVRETTTPESASTMKWFKQVEAAEVCLLDYFGSGGTDGCQGASTSRHTAFKGLGKGRKQARDGGAWNAAIMDAYHAFRQEAFIDAIPVIVPWTFEDDTPVIGLAFKCEENSFDGGADFPDGDDSLWELRTIAREGLRVSLGMDAWFPESPVGFMGKPKDWAIVVNYLEARLQKIIKDREEKAERDG